MSAMGVSGHRTELRHDPRPGMSASGKASMMPHMPMLAFAN